MFVSLQDNDLEGFEPLGNDYSDDYYDYSWLDEILADSYDDNYEEGDYYDDYYEDGYYEEGGLEGDLNIKRGEKDNTRKLNGTGSSPSRGLRQQQQQQQVNLKSM